MIREPDRHRIGKARLLRRQGKTYNEIREVIGSVDDVTLAGWLRGIPRPAATFRAKAHTEQRRKCRELRADGLTYDEIADLTGASVGSMSLWLRDMPIARNHPAAKAHRAAAMRETLQRTRERKARDRAAEIAAFTRTIGTLSERELLLVGAAIYWAEGGKSKPWRVDDRMSFINSDPTMITLFLRWLDLLGADRTHLRFRVHIHESADVGGAERYWADHLGVDPARMQRTTLKRHNPKTVRLNTGDGYRGCLVVNVLRSRTLYRRTAGLWQGIVDGSESPELNRAD